MPQKGNTDNNLLSGLLYFFIFGVLTFAFIYLQKNDWFKDNRIYQIVYEDVSGLTKGSPVKIRGVKVGKVKKISVNPEDNKTVLVEIKVKGKYKIPKDTKAAFASAGLIDGKMIVLEYNGNCQEPNCAQDGDKLEGRTVGMFESLLSSGEKEEEANIQDMMQEDIDDVMKMVKDKYMAPDSDNLISNTLRDMDFLQKKLTSLQSDLGTVMTDLDQQSKQITSSLDNINNNLNKDGKLERLMADADIVMKKLDQLSIEPTLKKADATMKRVDGMKMNLDQEMKGVNASMAEAKNIMKDLNTLLEKAKNGDNTAAYIMNKEGLSQDLNSTMTSLNQLGQDFEEKPYLFIPFKKRKKFLKKKKAESANE